ncbi:MAG: DnaJ domain-containing protein [bacterium JZ-2024 1]
MINYYRILRIYPTASDALIREAYKARMKQLMDGYGGEDPEEQAALINEVREAFEVLSNPKKRSEYDRILLEHLMAGDGEERTTERRERRAEPDAQFGRAFREQLLREGERRKMDVESFLQRQPVFRGSESRPHYLEEKSPEPEPVAPVEALSPETVTSLDEGLSAAASLLVDGKPEASLAFLDGLRHRFTDDPLQAKVLLRIGEIYFKHLGSPEKAISYYREAVARFPGTLDALLAEKRLASLGNAPSGMEVNPPMATIREIVGDMLVVDCPHCGTPQNIPNRRDVWYICAKCGERFSV